MDFLAQAVSFARENHLLLCFDAPYTDVTYDGYVAPSVLQVPGAVDVVVEFNSLSKTFNMAGWRVGMAVGNSTALKALAQVKSNVDSGMFHPLQDAAVAALETDTAWIAERNAEYRERIDIVIEGLAALDINIKPPRAALYIWAPVPEGYLAETFAMQVLEQAGVAVAPGSFFGPSGEGYIRISITASKDKLRSAMERFSKFRL
jgi:LL-diaminopimelate aminotransferase